MVCKGGKSASSERKKKRKSKENYVCTTESERKIFISKVVEDLFDQ